MNSNHGNIQGTQRKWNGSDYNVLCDICGRKKKRSECTMAFGTGDISVVMSCLDRCADVRHPLNEPPPIIFDGQPVADARPESQDTYITVNVISGFTWGHFPGGSWAHFNGTNSIFNLNPVWTWGNFDRN